MKTYQRYVETAIDDVDMSVSAGTQDRYLVGMMRFGAVLKISSTSASNK